MEWTRNTEVAATTSGWLVDPRSFLTKGLIVGALVAMGVPLVHTFTLNGEKLRAEFETERAFVWGAASLGPFAVYATLTGVFAVCILSWAASVGAKSAG